MGGEWTSAALADLSSDVSYGYTESASSEKVGPRFLRITDIQNGIVNWSEVPYCPITRENHDKYKLYDGDIVVARTGNSTGENFLYQGQKDAVFASYLIRFRIDRQMADPKFVWYNLRSRAWWDFINNSKTGSAQAGANAKVLGTFTLRQPPLAEQRAIAHILGTLDDKIELNRRRSQTLEAMARALFKDWFVDFGPVRAKCRGGFQTRPDDYPPHILDLFPDRLDDDGKPEGWRYTTLASFASLNPESWTKKNAPREIRYVDLSNTKQGTIEGAVLMPWSEAPSRAQRILRPGDTIVGTVRPGNKSFAFIGDEGMTGSTGFAVLRPLEKDFEGFIYLAATSLENIERLTHLADGAAYPAVRPDVVLGTPITAPPGEDGIDVLRGFSNAVSGWLDAIEYNKQESRTIAQLRDTLLPKLISGELRITDAEKFMEGVA